MNLNGKVTKILQFYSNVFSNASNCLFILDFRLN